MAQPFNRKINVKYLITVTTSFETHPDHVLPLIQKIEDVVQTYAEQNPESARKATLAVKV